MEPERGVFRRAPVKLDSEETTTQEEQMKATPKPQAPTGALSRLASLGQQAMQNSARIVVLAERAEELAKTMKEVADLMRKLSREIDEAALDIEEQKSSASADAEKLKQLQTLLKSLAT